MAASRSGRTAHRISASSAPRRGRAARDARRASPDAVAYAEHRADRTTPSGSRRDPRRRGGRAAGGSRAWRRRRRRASARRSSRIAAPCVEGAGDHAFLLVAAAQLCDSRASSAPGCRGAGGRSRRFCSCGCSRIRRPQNAVEPGMVMLNDTFWGRKQPSGFRSSGRRLSPAGSRPAGSRAGLLAVQRESRHPATGRRRRSLATARYGPNPRGRRRRRSRPRALEVDPVELAGRDSPRTRSAPRPKPALPLG